MCDGAIFAVLFAMAFFILWMLSLIREKNIGETNTAERIYLRRTLAKAGVNFDDEEMRLDVLDKLYNKDQTFKSALKEAMKEELLADLKKGKAK